jgi:acyl-CoA synthetase (AMP-forming)/AMP-acid ligase II
VSTPAFHITPELIGADIASGVMFGARKHPDKPALLFEDRCLSFSELAERIQRVAALARDQLDLRPGDRAAIYAANCLPYIEIVAGLSRAGVMVATPTHRAGPEELRRILENCQAKVLFHQDGLPGVTEEMDGLKTLSLDTGYEVLLQGQSIVQPVPPADPAATFCIPYTSGTTGDPKGVMLSHNCRGHLFKAMAHHFRCLGPEDQHLCFAPLAHGGGFGFAMASVFNGGTLELLATFDPSHVMDRLASGEVTSVFMVPTHVHQILALPEGQLARRDGFRLNGIVVNAAPFALALKQRAEKLFGEGIMHECYGCTEVGIATALPPELFEQRHGSVGQAILGTEICIRREDRSPADVYEIGDIWVKSPTLFNGYCRDPDATAEALDQDWLLTGDMGAMDEDGFLSVMDRRKDMVISGGINIYPREVEEVLMRHESIAEAAVVGIPDAEWGERLAAVIVLKPGQPGSVDGIISYCRGFLGGYKVPRQISFVEALVRNPAGKVMKRTIREHLSRDIEGTP